MVGKTRALDDLTSAESGREASRSVDGARSVQYFGLALMLAVTLAAGYTAGNLLGHPETPVAYSSLPARSETARAFYDALDQALAGGDTDTLAALLAPGFLDHDASAGEAQTTGEFLDRMRTLGQLPGVARLSVESIEASGSSLIVQVRQAAPGPRALAGISLQQVEGQPIFEVLRVARERVIDRWTLGIERLEATEFEDVAVRAPGLTNLSTTLVRVDLLAGVVYRLSSVERGFLVIESGIAIVRAIDFDGDEETHELERGSATSLTAADRIELRSADGKPARALVYELVRRVAADVHRPTSDPRAGSEEAAQPLLWSGPSPQADVGTVHRLAQVVLPARTAIRLTGAPDVTLILAVDSGTIEFVAPGSSFATLGEDFWPVEHANFARIDAQHAASLTGARAITLRNVSDHPVTTTLVVIKAESPNGSNPGPRMSA